MKRITSIHFTKPEADCLRSSIEKIIEKGLGGTGSSEGDAGAVPLPESDGEHEAATSSGCGLYRGWSGARGDHSE